VPQPGLFAGAIGTVSPTLAQNMRAAWEAVNNGWNQWVLNYTQSRQLNLLKNIGFEAPSLEDLAYVLLIACWWARAWRRGLDAVGAQPHDPWLRLLGQARASGWPKAGLRCPRPRRRARWRRRPTPASARIARRPCATGC
jgi:hypothetical protein